MTAEKVVNAPSTPAPSPALSQAGARRHRAEMHAPRRKEPTTLIASVAHGNCAAPCGRARSIASRSPVPTIPPMSTAASSRHPILVTRATLVATAQQRRSGSANDELHGALHFLLQLVARH